jgi:hypothetical protein
MRGNSSCFLSIFQGGVEQDGILQTQKVHRPAAFDFTCKLAGQINGHTKKRQQGYFAPFFTATELRRRLEGRL